MALTEKMLEKAREQLESRVGSNQKVTDEQCVKAYLEHGSFAEASHALNVCYQTVRRRVFRALGKGNGQG